MTPRFTQKLALSLFENEATRAAFLQALEGGRIDSSAMLWLVERPADLRFTLGPRHSWLPDYVDSVSYSSKAGSNPLHEDGAYYLLDLSSVFAASVLSVIDIKDPIVIDVCSAPGGKSVLAYRALSPKLLLSNEVIGKRSAALISNLKRCKIKEALVLQQDPENLSAACKDAVDVVIVDAPCSGQSLVARGSESPGAFHPATIRMNAMRQRRILANSLGMVRPGGYCAYITCTYSKEENEEVISWALQKFPEFKTVAVNSINGFKSEFVDFPCYRMWPHIGPGAGSFTALLKRDEGADRGEINVDSLNVTWSSSNTISAKSKSFDKTRKRVFREKGRRRNRTSLPSNDR